MKLAFERIILVGAGGAGMSAVAKILADLGFGQKIICIDAYESQLLEQLRDLGLKIVIGHGKVNIGPKDAVIYSDATLNSPEVQQAKNREYDPKNPNFVMSYFQFMGEISKHFQTLAIIGTNGKSSTTSLAIYLAKNKIKNFAIGIVGALVPDLGNKNYYLNPKLFREIREIFYNIFSKQPLAAEISKKYLFIVEACEHMKHFHFLDPDRAILTSLTYDHATFYKTKQDYNQAFLDFFKKVKYKIFLIQPLSASFASQKEKFFIVKKINFVFKYVFGDHWQINGNLVYAWFKYYLKNKFGFLTKKASLQLFFCKKKIFRNFKGVWRRLEFLGEYNGNLIYSDYAHTPDSLEIIGKSLKKKYPKKKIILIFQPHQITRILSWWNDFGVAFSGFEEVFIYKIYVARENLQEKIQEAVNLKDLQGVKSIEELGQKFAQKYNGQFLGEIGDVKKLFDRKKDSIFVIATAGDLDFLVRKMLGK